MNALNILFLNCTLKRSPEVSNTEALWTVVAQKYQQQGHRTHQLRVIDYEISQKKDYRFSAVLQHIQAAHILIVGLSVRHSRSPSIYYKLLEKLQGDRTEHQLYNKVFGLLLTSDAEGGGHCIAQAYQDFSRLGCTQPPNNTVSWSRSIDAKAGFIEARGEYAITVNTAAGLLVGNSIAIAQALYQHPLKPNIASVQQAARAIAKSAPIDTAATQITPKAIRTESTIDPNLASTIDYRQLTKRIWTVMQAGMERGFSFKVLSLRDRTFQAERDGKGFIYKIYPGHFSFRRQYQDYDYEQTKAYKLSLMKASGLAVPISYGLFASFTEITQKIQPQNLPFPLVVKPDSGSLSENVFPNLTTPNQLQQCADIIAANGSTIQLESHISGRDYRVLILDHKYAGCVERRPANVTGDGQHSILELFRLRNEEVGRGDRYEAHTTIHKLVFDDTSRRLLAEAGYSLETVLPPKEVVYLQEKITASTGSDYIDCTDQLHHSIIQSCIDFSYKFTTLTLGFDLIVSDISKPLSETGGAFNEYNFLPYVDLHENCNVGQKRPVCRLIWDYIEANKAKIVTSKFGVF